MPKGSPELTEKKKNEIVDACERVYAERGLDEATIKEIAGLVKMTRPAVYHYFDTKEEILLALLVREYEKWLCELRKVAARAIKDRAALAKAVARTLVDRGVMLRIMSMNLFEIERRSRVERLAEFKRKYLEQTTLFTEMLRQFNPEMSESECGAFCRGFDSFLFGVYLFTRHTDKQIEAMKLAGGSVKEFTIFEMVYDFLLNSIPNE